MVAFIGAADSASLARFDPATSLHWLRGRLRDDGEPPHPTLKAIYANAVWAAHGQTVRDEALGSGSGEPLQTFFARRLPLLEGDILEVSELDGPRAAVELPILAREVPAADLNVVREAGGGLQVWVRWHPQPNFYLSAPGDRHYTVERSGGRILFGDGTNGRILPAGRDNVRLRVYRTGGGSAGNVAAGSITQLLGGIPYVSGVTNPSAAEGGADGETTGGIGLRGPQALRHRDRSISVRDYESLAREASPGVKLARAIPTNDLGRRRAGWVRLVIVPDSADPRPTPSFELRRQVQSFIEERAPAGLGGLRVVGPHYLPVGVNAVVAPLDLSQAGPVGESVGRALEGFFHPLTGGPEGEGWPFGRDVYLSDVAALIENLPGVDYVQELDLLLDNLPIGEQVEVPDDRIVVAGTMKVLIRAAER
jgi:predicted phage baseplate assembly protein